MPVTKEQILAGLKKVGPCAPVVLGEHLGGASVSPSQSPALRLLLDEGKIKSQGKGRGLVLALSEQKFDDEPPATSRRAPAKKHGKSKARKQRRAKIANVTGAFLAADNRILLLGHGQPQILAPEHTPAIAELVFAHFEA